MFGVVGFVSSVLIFPCMFLLPYVEWPAISELPGGTAVSAGVGVVDTAH